MGKLSVVIPRVNAGEMQLKNLELTEFCIYLASGVSQMQLILLSVQYMRGIFFLTLKSY